MDNNQDILLNSTFIDSLGKLFYAIASCDGLVHEKELNILNQLLKKEWSQFVKLHTDYAKYTRDDIMESVRQIGAQKTIENADFYFNAFIQYKMEHESQFTLPLRKFILTTCNAISNSYAKKNKSELMMLAKLSLNFNKSKR